MKAIQFATIVVLSLLMLADAAPQVLADGGLVNVDGVHYVRGKRQAPGGACVINCDDASGDIPEGGACTTNFDFGVFFGSSSCGIPCIAPPCQQGLECNIPDGAEACSNNCIASWSGTCGVLNAAGTGTPRRRSIAGLSTQMLARRGNVTLSSLYGVGTCTNPQDKNYVCAAVDNDTGRYFFICRDPASSNGQADVCFSMCYADTDAPCSCYWLGSEWCSKNNQD